MAQDPPTPTFSLTDSMSPNSVYRWEAASGLEHTCYACTMKMNHPKARQSCYGTHSIPCFRYHQTMHAIGTSHNCFACIQADTLHENRHRKIAELVAEYKDADDEQDSAGPRRAGLRERNVNIPAGQRPHPAHQHHDDDDKDNDTDTADLMDNSSISNNSEASIPKLSKAEQRTHKRAAKEQKSQLKAAKNQLKHNVSVKAEDVQKVQQILHGDEEDESRGTRHPLASDESIEEVMKRNMAFVSNIQQHKAYLLKSVAERRKSDKERKRLKKQQHRPSDNHHHHHHHHQHHQHHHGGVGDSDDENEEVVDAILLRLGVTLAADQNGSGSSHGQARGRASSSAGEIFSTRKAGGSGAGGKVGIVEKLREAIRDDLEKHENEQRQTCIRAGGFWRYVGRTVFERMTEVARRIDWKTGMILGPE